MQSSFEPTCGFTLATESSAISLRHDDGGNWTGGHIGVGALIGSKYGVSAPELSDYLSRLATAADMAAVTVVVATAIFGANTWNRLAADHLPVGVDFMTADHGYNRGAASSALVLQRLVGADADGWIGQQTVAAIASFEVTRVDVSRLDPRALQEAVGATQDGVIGAKTIGALTALPVDQALLACLYGAQVRDYRGLAAAPDNPGWFSRARARWIAARSLSAPVS